jgi:glycosyltransferase involved in cell wall biosynthesis
MAAGHAVIAADCRFGPREIVSDGKDGLLVPASDPAAMAQALARLMDDVALRRRLGTAARQSIQRFAIDIVMGGWTELVHHVLDKNAEGNDKKKR